MSRFRFKPILWAKDDVVSSPYGPAGSNSNQSRTTDPDLPRVNEVFQDDNGDLFLHKRGIDGVLNYKRFKHDDHHDEDLIRNKKFSFRDENYPTVALHLDNHAGTILGYDSGLIRFLDYRSKPESTTVVGQTWLSISLADYTGGSNIGAANNRHPIALGVGSASGSSIIVINVLTSNRDLFCISIDPESNSIGFISASHSAEFVDISEFELFFLRENISTGMAKVAIDDYSYVDVPNSLHPKYIAPRGYFDKDLENGNSNCAIVCGENSNEFKVILVKRMGDRIFDSSFTPLTEFSATITSLSYRGDLPWVYQIGKETLIAIFSSTVNNRTTLSNSTFAVLYHKGITRVIDIRVDQLEGVSYNKKEILGISPLYNENNANNVIVGFKFSFIYTSYPYFGIMTYEVAIPEDYDEDHIDATLISSVVPSAYKQNNHYGINSKTDRTDNQYPLSGISESITYFTVSGMNSFVNIREYPKEIGNSYFAAATVVSAIAGTFAKIQTKLAEIGELFVNRTLTVVKDIISTSGNIIANAGSFIAEQGDHIGKAFKGISFKGSGEIRNSIEDDLPDSGIKTDSITLDETNAYLEFRDYNVLPNDKYSIVFTQFSHRGNIGGTYLVYGSNSLFIDSITGSALSYFGHTNFKKGKYFNFFALADTRDTGAGTTYYTPVLSGNKIYGFYENSNGSLVYDEINLSSIIGGGGFNTFLGLETGYINNTSSTNEGVELIFLAEGNTGNGKVRIRAFELNDNNELEEKYASTFTLRSGVDYYVMPGMISFYNGRLRFASRMFGSASDTSELFDFIEINFTASWNPQYNNIIRGETVINTKVVGYSDSINSFTGLAIRRRFVNCDDDNVLSIAGVSINAEVIYDLSINSSKGTVSLLSISNTGGIRGTRLPNWGTNAGVKLTRILNASGTSYDYLINDKKIPSDYAPIHNLCAIGVSGSTIYEWEYASDPSGHVAFERKKIKGELGLLSANLSGLKASSGYVEDLEVRELSPERFIARARSYNSASYSVASLITQGDGDEYARYLVYNCTGHFSHQQAGDYGEFHMRYQENGEYHYLFKPLREGQIMIINNANESHSLHIMIPKTFNGDPGSDSNFYSFNIDAGATAVLQAVNNTWIPGTFITPDIMSKLVRPFLSRYDSDSDFRVSSLITRSTEGYALRQDKLSNTSSVSVGSDYVEIGEITTLPTSRRAFFDLTINLARDIQSTYSSSCFMATLKFLNQEYQVYVSASDSATIYFRVSGYYTSSGSTNTKVYLKTSSTTGNITARPSLSRVYGTYFFF